MLHWIATKLGVRNWLLRSLGARQTTIPKTGPDVLMAVLYAGTTEDGSGRINVIFNDNLNVESMRIVAGVGLRSAAAMLSAATHSGMERALEEIAAMAMDRDIVTKAERWEL